MGLFSKKTLKCEKCGKGYESRVSIGTNLCPECAARLKEKQKSLSGYVEYAKQFKKKYNEDELDAIALHRAGILRKYVCPGGITRQELREAAANRKNLTDEQCGDILKRMAKSMVYMYPGMAFTGEFIIPMSHPGLAVDAEDVFAVCLAGDFINHNAGKDKTDLMLCTLFTNDPYVPIIKMAYLAEMGFFEVLKSKEGRRSAANLFRALCPNLAYPVQPARELKKTVKTEKSVRGNLPIKFMLEQLDIAGGGNAGGLATELPKESVEMLESIGYMTRDDMRGELEMDKMISGRFWSKQEEKAGIEI